MATNTNKKSTLADDETASAVKVGDGKGTAAPRKPRPSLTIPHKKAVAILVVIIVLIGAWAIFGLNVGKKVYAQAAGHKIYKEDVEAIKAHNKSISDNAAATVLANKYLSQAMAKENNVRVTQADINAAGCPSQKTNPFGYQTCVNQLYFTKLGNNNEGIYKGKALITNFSRYIPYPSPLLEQEKALNPKIGDSAAIAADKAYAKAFITDLYNQIMSGKITFDQAIQMEHADPQVGEQAYPSLAHSGSFDGLISQDNLISANSIRQKITSMKPGEITKPFAVVSGGSKPLAGDSSGETYFLVVDMEQISGGHGKTSFDQELQQAKKKLGYKVNV